MHLMGCINHAVADAHVNIMAKRKKLTGFRALRSKKCSRFPLSRSGSGETEDLKLLNDSRIIKPEPLYSAALHSSNLHISPPTGQNPPTPPFCSVQQTVFFSKCTVSGSDMHSVYAQTLFNRLFSCILLLYNFLLCVLCTILCM